MANTPKLLAQTTLAAGSNTIYTSPALTTTVINNVTLTNTSASAVTVDIIVGDSGSEKVWRDNLALAGNSTVEFNGAFSIEAADVVKATPSTADVVDLVMTGLQVT